MAIWKNILTIITLLVMLGIAAYTTYLSYYFSYEFRLCEPIHNCTYHVFDKYNDGWWFYQYVINNKYRCLFLCSKTDPTNISHCPINGSRCHLNYKVYDNCMERWIPDLFDCIRPFWISIMLSVSMAMISSICLMCIIFFISYIFYNICCVNNDNINKSMYEQITENSKTSNV